MPNSVKSHTVHGKRIDEQIDHHMGLIADAVIKTIGEPAALILGGGFARGEGSVKINNGVVYPLNDYDVIILTKKRLSISEHTLNKIALDLSKEITPTSFSFTNSTNLINFYVDFRNMTIKELTKLPPLLKYYELKHSGRVIFGDPEILKHIPDYHIEEIPREDGIRFLFNRMSLLVEYFKTKYTRNEMNTQEKETLIYFISKMYLSVAEALTLLSNKFEPSYMRRSQVLEDSYKEDHPELYHIIPNLPRIVTWATNCKLDFDQCTKSMEIEEAINLWFETRDNLNHVVAYCFKSYGVNPQIDWIKTPDILIKTLRGKFYIDYTKDITKSKFRLPLPRGTSKYVSYAAQIYLNWLYYRRLKNLKGISYWKLFSEITDPGLKIYRGLPHVLYALQKDGTVDQEMTATSIDNLKKLQPVPQDLCPEDWDSTAQFYTDVFRIYQFLMQL